MATTEVISGANTISAYLVSVPVNTTDVFTFSFPYLSRNDFKIVVDKTTVLDAADYQFDSDYLIRLTETGRDKLNGIYAGVPEIALVISRSTQLNERLVDFQDGANMTEEELDLNSNQTFYLLQEAYDTFLYGSLTYDAITNTVDANTAEIVNAGYPTRDQNSVATVESVLDLLGIRPYVEGESYKVNALVEKDDVIYTTKVELDPAPAFDLADVKLVINRSDAAQILQNVMDIEENAIGIADLYNDTGAILSFITNINDDVIINDGAIKAIEDSIGVADGIASLDNNGKVPLAQIPSAVQDSLAYKGKYNAATGLPSLPTGSETNGDYYIVEGSGTQDVGTGSLILNAGDKLIYLDGYGFDHIDNTESVTDVNGKTGSVSLDADDVSETSTKFWDVKNNRGSLVNPDVDDDVTQGYSKGSTWFNETTSMVYILKDATEGAADWKPQGSSGVGSPSIYRVYNAEDGDLTGFSNFTLNEINPINGNADYSVSSFPASIPDTMLFNRNTDKRNTCSIEYKLTSGTAKVVLSGGGLSRDVEAELSPDDKRVVLEFTPTSILTDVSLEFQDVSSATGLSIDDIVFSDAPPETKEFTVTQNSKYSDRAGFGSTNSNIPYFSELTSSSGSEVYTQENSSVNGLSFTMLRDAQFTIAYSFSHTGTGEEGGVSLNGTGSVLTTAGGYSSAPQSVRQVMGSSDGNVAKPVTVTIDAKEGDVVRPNSNNPVNLGNSDDWMVVVSATATKEGTVYGSDVTDADLENVFSARIANNGTASITSQNVEFIESVTRSALGRVDVVYKTGFFSVAPSVAAVADSTNSRWLSITGASLTGFSVFTYRHDNVAEDWGFDFHVQRQGSDYRSKANYIDNLILENPDGGFETTTKVLSANVTAIGDISDLTFTGLEVGAKYLLTGSMYVRGSDGQDNAIFYRSESGNAGTLYGAGGMFKNGVDISAPHLGVSQIIVAETSNLYFYKITAGNEIYGNNTKQHTYLTLTKLPKTQGVMTLNGSGTVHKTDGTEYLTGEYMDIGGVKKPIYARTYVAQGLAATSDITLGTLPANLENIDISFTYVNNFNDAVQRTRDYAGGTQVYPNLAVLTGVFTLRVDSQQVKAYKVKITYTKP